MKRYILPDCILVSLLLLLSACDGNTVEPPVQTPSGTPVTFIEIGSIHCEPCRMMQPIMESLAEKYGPDQLTVLFLDVIKDKPEADIYRIRVMPTQVFLDEDGVEFHRHEGFYPEEEIDSLLAGRNLTLLPGK